MLLVLEVMIIVCYGVFVRFSTSAANNYEKYPAYQDVNVMMLIGFGFLMTFIKSHMWSALMYTFFINSIVVQLYVLFNGFWKRVLHDGFSGGNAFYINIEEQTFTGASYAAAAMLISFGGVIGRVGPK